MSGEDQLIKTIETMMESIRLLGETVSIHSDSLRVMSITVAALVRQVSDIAMGREGDER